MSRAQAPAPAAGGGWELEMMHDEASAREAVRVARWRHEAAAAAARERRTPDTAKAEREAYEAFTDAREAAAKFGVPYELNEEEEASKKREEERIAKLAAKGAAEALRQVKQLRADGFSYDEISQKTLLTPKEVRELLESEPGRDAPGMSGAGQRPALPGGAAPAARSAGKDGGSTVAVAGHRQDAHTR